MASSSFVIRCKTVKGLLTISSLSGNSSLKALKEAVRSFIDIEPGKMKILKGFPPQPLKSKSDYAKLNELDIHSGETLIIEADDNLDNQVVPEVLERVPDDVSDFKQEVPDMVNQVMTFSGKNNQMMDALTDSCGIMMRHDVPSDNSCLFSSIYYIMNGGKLDLERSNDLRRVIAETITKDPVTYNSAYLGRSNEEYCQWILNPNNWGGAIELAIFSEHFQLEICAIDVISCQMLRFGENKNHKIRGILLYDGIHYDPLVLHLQNEQLTLFSAYNNSSLEKAMEIAREAQSSRQFTDTQNFKLKCNECGCHLVGDKEASSHAASTGHIQFGEL